ncbi:MAG: hypothetical protein PW735_07945, partial [Acidobacteriaceae bacterium]|nr:hypothetical protein [Acidobacteriaceae bacterium]
DVSFSVNNPNADFRPLDVNLSAGGTGSTILTLFAYNVDAANRPPGIPAQDRHGLRPGVVLAMLLAFPRRRKRLGVILGFVVTAAMVSIVGCAASGAPPSGPGAPTAPGSYSITVTASANSGAATISHTTTINLVVVR